MIETCAIALLTKIAAAVNRNNTVFPLVKTLSQIPHEFEITVFVSKRFLDQPTLPYFDTKGRAMAKEESRTAACAK